MFFWRKGDLNWFFVTMKMLLELGQIVLRGTREKNHSINIFFLFFSHFQVNIFSFILIFQLSLLVDGTKFQCSWSASMKMNILPFSIALMPNACLFRLMRVSNSLSVEFFFNNYFFTFFN